jgi:hypothetical protein
VVDELEVGQGLKEVEAQLVRLEGLEVEIQRSFVLNSSLRCDPP